MADENIFFMRVDEPLEVRKQLLECCRMSIHALQRYERTKELRKRKAELVAQLRGDLKELTQLVLKLRAAFPEAASLPAQEVQQVAKRDAKRQGNERHATHVDADKSVERLHHQLKAIEHKLNALG